MDIGAKVVSLNIAMSKTKSRIDKVINDYIKKEISKDEAIAKIGDLIDELKAIETELAEL